jgi:hypothetical protein
MELIYHFISNHSSDLKPKGRYTAEKTLLSADYADGRRFNKTIQV